MKLNDLFEVKNGITTTSLEVSNERTDGLIPFLRPARTQQRTISGWVRKNDLPKGAVFPKGSLIVSTNGEGSHSFSYVTSFEFSANSDVSILVPKHDLSLQEKIFYAKCITLNRWKFSYGRKPKGDRLKDLELPDTAPHWVQSLPLEKSVEKVVKGLSCGKIEPESTFRAMGESRIRLSELFDVYYGSNLELVNLAIDSKGVNFVSRTSKNNGVTAKVALVEGLKPIEGPVLTVAGGGSVLETFLQLDPFYSGRDLFYLKPKTTLTTEELLFYCTCIRMNMFRYSYGRQANRTLKDLLIPSIQSIPSWVSKSMPKISEASKKLIISSLLMAE